MMTGVIDRAFDRHIRLLCFFMSEAFDNALSYFKKEVVMKKTKALLFTVVLGLASVVAQAAQLDVNVDDIVSHEDQVRVGYQFGTTLGDSENLLMTFPTARMPSLVQDINDEGKGKAFTSDSYILLGYVHQGTIVIPGTCNHISFHDTLHVNLTEKDGCTFSYTPGN